ncbi:MAG TPA: ketoacyl-ACP synthase III [Salinisphaeraceae bacterium]|nr:ketoacyl-ACP synthase III [Salinisphaeraceae bacterium]
MHAAVEAIEYVLPARTETIEELAQTHPHWRPRKLARRTGIRTRHIAAAGETASDLALQAAEQLFARAIWTPEDFDFLLFCTQTPDHFLPSTACLMQERLQLSTSAGALDINLGCSGFIYALGLAKGLIETGQARRILLITADTYTKFIHPEDKSVRALFSDAAAATVVSASAEEPAIGPFVYGTDGSGGHNLIVPMGGMRQPLGDAAPPATADRFGNCRSARNIYMNGKAIVDFSLQEVPRAIHSLCERAGITLDDIDAVVPHQASAKVLQGIRADLELPPERFIACMEDIGNTVSCSIPIALSIASRSGLLKPAAYVMLVGFGVGLSWGATLVQLPESL